MKTIAITIAMCAIATSAVFGQVVKDESLEQALSNPQVETELDNPDGVCLTLAEDGSIQYLARGSADYNFGTPKDIRNKKMVAELEAKRHLVQFIEGSVLKDRRIHVVSATEQTSKSSDGNQLSVQATAEDFEMANRVVEEYTSGRLMGVVILKVEKIPQEGSKTSGEIQVTIGMSKKTRAASDSAHNMIIDSLNARRKVGDPAPKTNGNGRATNGGREKGGDDSTNTNKPEVRVNNTLF